MLAGSAAIDAIAALGDVAAMSSGSNIGLSGGREMNGSGLTCRALDLRRPMRDARFAVTSIAKRAAA
jgi:hypothetical protein